MNLRGERCAVLCIYFVLFPVTKRKFVYVTYMAEALRLSEVCFLIEAQGMYLQSTHAPENIYKQMFRYTVA